jgi:hypothetical protein
MMWLATIRAGMTDPILTKVIGDELVFDQWGNAQRRPRQPFARKLKGGGACALSQTPAGAIASAKCVMSQTDLERDLLSKRDRS